MDRTRAQQVGYSQQQIAEDVLIGLSGSFQTTPTFYLNPQNHVSYNLAVQTPQYKVESLQALENFPIATLGTTQQAQILGNLASIDRGASKARSATTTRAGDRYLWLGRGNGPCQRCEAD